LLLLALLIPAWLSGELQTHTVQKGENLYRISRQYNVTIDQIKELNGLSSDNIGVGQILKIKEQEPEKPDFKVPSIPATPSAQAEAPTVTTAPAAPVDYTKIKLPEDHYHAVQPGENAYRIAKDNGLALNDLIRWNNLDSETPVVKVGTKLIIKDPSAFAKAEVKAEAEAETRIQAAEPAPADTLLLERVYVVKKKDTLYSIAKANGMTVAEIKSLNKLTSDDISVGQKLWLAGTPPEGEDAGDAAGVGVAGAGCFMPTQGKVTSEFGMRRGRPHKGIDIANRSGTPIYAALDGVVVFSGVQRGYGNVILIEHPNFVMTVYAHSEKNLVKVGDRVKRGQHIANMGSTGNSTGPHLHFEYRVKGTAINPRKVLPF